MHSRELFRLAKEAYFRTSAIGGHHAACAEAVREAIAPYGGYVVDGHPVPYSLTVYNRNGDSLGYLGPAIKGGYEQH